MPFREVLGHHRVMTLLSRAIARGSLTPSLILSGPEGVGKRLTAFAVAQALNCTNPRSPADSRDSLATDACGVCPSCRRIVRGAHPDVQIIRPGETGSIKIDQVRAAIDAAMFRPFEGRRRVTIVEEADGLVPAAQNALLKTLEEPPASSVFILVTSRPDVLLPTVRSRCAQVRFGRLNVADVAQVLERAHGYSPSNAAAVAAVSDGSVRRALELQADDSVAARDAAEGLLGVSSRDPRALLDHARELLQGGGSAAAEREYLGVRLQALSSVLRDIGLLGSGGDVRHLANADRRPVLDGLARTFTRERVERAYAAVIRAQDALDRNVGPKVVADWLALNVH